MRSHASVGRVLGLLVPTLILSCSSGFDNSRTLPPRGTLGAELFGVMCDRLGGQSLHEDLTGASYYNICHAPYADKVDQAQLPPLLDGQPNLAGNPVPIAQQQSDRAYGVGRLETLAKHRTPVIAALDVVFPDVQIAVKDIGNPDPTRSCLPPASGPQGRLHDELSALLGRFQSLYNDGTIPQSTESLAAVVNAFKSSPEAQAAWAVYDARAGYRPIDLNLGAARPSIAYAGLRDLANGTLSLVSADSDPYAASPKVDSSGNRIPVPGPAYPQLQAVLAAARLELLNATADPAPAPLTKTVDPITGRTVLSRPRLDLELLQTILYATDPSFGTGGSSRYIVQRDPRGYVLVPPVGGALPAPFVDTDGDGLADVDGQGAFVTSDGSQAPTPFFALNAPDARARDSYQRALTGSGGPPLYGFLDTSQTYTATVLKHLGPLVDPNPADQHETLMDLFAGAEIVLGARKTGATKAYASKDTLTYTGFDPNASPLLDLVYALGQVMGDPTTSDTFSYLQALIAKDTPVVARLVGDGLYAKSLANADVSASIPAQSTLWDEMIDVTVQIEQEPGLLEDVLRALGSDASLPLSTVFSGYIGSSDHISYDRSHLNGPAFNVTTGDTSQPKTPVDRSKPDAGWNRSQFQRFLQAIHDTNGVTACNKAGAVAHAQGLPIIGSADVCDGGLCNFPLFPKSPPFAECKAFMIPNLASFYLDSIVGAASLYFRADVLREGLSLLGLTKISPATVGMIEQSSGLGYSAIGVDQYNGPDLSKPGFWDLAGTTQNSCGSPDCGFRPKPGWLNRLVFFDQVKDSPSPGQPNYTTNHFLTDLQGTQIGTAACPERLIPDPCKGDASCGGGANVAPDGMVHGLRACPVGGWAFDRDQDSTFVWEDLGFYNAITPLVSAFATANNPTTGKPRHREDLFIGLMEVLHKHWQTAQGAQTEPADCALTLSPATSCTKDGASTYEPLLTKIFSSDMLTAVHDLVKVVSGLTIPTCAASSPTGQCTKAGSPASVDGVTVLAAATRALLDPGQAKKLGLTDRKGSSKGLRNDGTTNPQVTPLYLILEALNGFDAAFAAYAKAHPNDTGRQAQWRRARSQLVDQFLSVNGQNTTTQSFADPSLPKILPILLDAVRTQVTAHCPGPPFGTCTWARQDLTQHAADTVGGPTLAGAVDLMDSIRQNDAGRAELEKLLTYLVNAASGNDALAALLSSSDDLIQVMLDDANLVPLYHVLSAATAPTTTDSSGAIHRGFVDATTTLLSRIAGRAYQGSTEVCSNELDPNGVLPMALGNLVTPLKDASGNPSETPLEVIMDAISDVNRQTPGASGPVKSADLGNTASELSQFFLDPQRGLEQFYAIVRNGTIH